MGGGPSKVNPPNSHPSNPTHKAAMAAQNPEPAAKQETASPETTQPEKAPLEKTPGHEINKAVEVIVGAVGAVALLFMAAR